MAEVLEDSAPVLEGGTGTPYIAIFKPNGGPIVDPSTNLPLGTFVTNFEYTYNEEKEDKGKIEIIINNPNIVDLPDIDYYRTIQIQWGYIYPSKEPFRGPVRSVLVTNRNFRFQSDGIHGTLEFSAPGVLLKSRSVHSNNCNKGFLDYLEGSVKGSQVGITLLDYSSSESQRVVVAQKEDRDINPDTDAAVVNENNEIVSAYSKWDTRTPLGRWSNKEMGDEKNYVYNTRLDASKNYEDLVPVKLLDYTPENSDKMEFLLDRFPEEYRRLILQEKRVSGIVFLGTSKNSWDQINEAINHLPNGPYYPDARDGQIVFHNQKSNRAVSKVYTWYGGNGELLEFTIDSKYVRSVVEVSQKSDIDPDSKSVVTETTQVLTNPSEGATDSHMLLRWPDDNYLNNDNHPFHRSNRIRGAVGTFVGGAIFGAAGGYFGGFWGGLAGAYIGGEVGGDIARRKDEYPYANFPGNEPSTANDVRGGKNSIPLLLRKPTEWDESAFGKVNSVEDKPFSSRKQAISYISQTHQITREELEQSLNNWQNRYNELQGTSSPEGRTKAMHTFQKLDDLVVKRKVKIRERVYPSYYSAKEYSTEEYVNTVKTQGLIKLPKTTVDNNIYYDGYNPTDFYSEGLRNISKVARVISGTEKRDNKVNINDWDKSVIVEYETEVEVPIPAARVLSEMPDDIMDNAINDLSETVKNTLTAKAKIIGDPTLESSMNLIIKNVSDKYSGTWYIKKIIHRISPSNGYTCDISFTKRVITNTAVHYVSKTNTIKGKMAKLRAIGREEAKKNNNAFDNAMSTIKELQKGNPNYLYVATQLEGGGFNVKGFPAVLSTRPIGVSESKYLSDKGTTYKELTNNHPSTNLQLNK